jgi:hypothetical protein
VLSLKPAGLIVAVVLVFVLFAYLDSPTECYGPILAQSTW